MSMRFLFVCQCKEDEQKDGLGSETRDRVFHDASYFSSVITFLDVEPLIMELLSFRESNLNLEITILTKICFGRDESKARILLLVLKLSNIRLMQQKTSRPKRIVIESVTSKLAG